MENILLILLLIYLAIVQGGQPNVLYILIDDQGWDDIGRNNPYVKTPNIDKFIQQSTLFDNMYVTPQCAQSRSEFLTGRWHPRTGTMGVSGGWDFINRKEVTIANVLGAAGYKTAHFGKWHNAQVLGYEPWFSGFQDSYIESFLGDNGGTASALMVHNGQYYLQQHEDISHMAHDMILKSKILKYLATYESSKQPAAGSIQPFFIYFAARAIHVNAFGFTATGKRVDHRVSPLSYRRRYYSSPRYAGIPNATLDAWAYLQYLDDAIGDLFNQLEANGLDKTTYIFLMGDNGSALLAGEDGPKTRKYRMPSGMAGAKGTVYEGGIRNFLAVSGPGVERGAVDSTLLDIKDILPTIAELAGVDVQSGKHLPWDGISFKHLLLPGKRVRMDSYLETGRTTTDSTDTGSTNADSRSSDALPAAIRDLSNIVATAGSASANAGTQHPDQATGRRRGSCLATEQQAKRMLVTLNPGCWSPNAVPLLDKDRDVIKPQPLLSFESGGLYWADDKAGIKPPAIGPGIKQCIAVRWRNYKYVGATDTVYSFAEGGLPHAESQETTVSEPHASDIKARLVSAARSWWQSLMAEPHSFLKPTFQLGLGGFNVTNMLAAGAHERTPGAITLTLNGAVGFENVGDRMCFKINVTTAGRYQIVPVYTSRVHATFKMSFGTFQKIQAGTAPSLTAHLPPQSTMAGMIMGYITLRKSQGKKTEACLEMVAVKAPGKPVFKSLGSIRITRRPRAQQQDDPNLELAINISRGGNDQSISSSSSSSSSTDSSSSGGNRSDANTPTAQPAPGLDFSKQHSWLLSSIAPDAPSTQAMAPATAETAWRQFRYKHRLPDGQEVLESLYSPYDSEGIEECRSWMGCMPQI